MARLPIHPGEILGDELEELGVNPHQLSLDLHVPANRVSRIINGQRGITADTTLRLGQWFGTGPELWMNPQKTYELRLAEEESGDEIRRMVAPRPGLQPNLETARS